MQKHTLSTLVLLLIVTALAIFCYRMVPNLDDNLDGGLSTYVQYRDMRPGVARYVLHYRPSDLVKPSEWIWQAEEENRLANSSSCQRDEERIPSSAPG